MRERLLRYVCAILVSLVATYSGLVRFALASPAAAPSCSLQDVQAWQMALSDPQEEATPDYSLGVTEDFLERCPDRPETAQAHQLAAMSAAWAGKTERAADHFAQAGEIRDSDALFMAAAVNHALGRTETAWSLRDQAIDLWLPRLTRRGVTGLTTRPAPGGEIISVTFRRQDKEGTTTRLWLARPEGPGWPAALSVSSSSQINAFHRLRAGEDAGTLEHVRLYRCRARRLLGRSDTPYHDDTLAAVAELSLTAYLASPDIPADGAFESCIFDGKILPDVTGAGASLVQ